MSLYCCPFLKNYSGIIFYLRSYTIPLFLQRNTSKYKSYNLFTLILSKIELNTIFRIKVIKVNGNPWQGNKSFKFLYFDSLYS